MKYSEKTPVRQAAPAKVRVAGISLEMYEDESCRLEYTGDTKKMLVWLKASLDEMDRREQERGAA
ncbi:hypothetical protein JD974_12325 [Chromobacterium haemolyticum]|uniref:Uncharacterized protein n=1 Tax=Chromobacterium haemolyticum TaxID=394935 RepID=A0ABS3GNH6_9NEIS|nr:hypothetical protein [Chromobacterium haemolyticum]MBK0415191.1 hypothetical protein [Chromobacterium haemolyticum]MBO0416594.1 hypothetical protein [Chromobacterium haemolyticum]MBO0499830.1 hypothetical protein [Chromobacterium haemolyticum]